MCVIIIIISSSSGTSRTSQQIGTSEAEYDTNIAAVKKAVTSLEKGTSAQLLLVLLLLVLTLLLLLVVVVVVAAAVVVVVVVVVMLLLLLSLSWLSLLLCLLSLSRPSRRATALSWQQERRLRLASQGVWVSGSSSWMVDLCGRRSQVGSLAGAAHRLNDNTRVLRWAQWELSAALDLFPLASGA